MTRFVLAILTLVALTMHCAPLAAQVAAGGTVTLSPGQSVTDGAGRTVTHTGSSGKLKVKYTGPIQRGEGSQPTTVGGITEVKNPKNASSGNCDSYSVDTNGNSTNVVNDADGSNVTVDGGMGNVTVGGDGNTVKAGGAGNSVTLNGDNNTGDGLNAQSSGTVTYGPSSSGNTWGGTGNFTVGN